MLARTEGRVALWPESRGQQRRDVKAWRHNSNMLRVVQLVEGPIGVKLNHLVDAPAVE